MSDSTSNGVEVAVEAIETPPVSAVEQKAPLFPTKILQKNEIEPSSTDPGTNVSDEATPINHENSTTENDSGHVSSTNGETNASEENIVTKNGVSSVTSEEANASAKDEIEVNSSTNVNADTDKVVTTSTNENSGDKATAESNDVSVMSVDAENENDNSNVSSTNEDCVENATAESNAFGAIVVTENVNPDETVPAIDVNEEKKREEDRKWKDAYYFLARGKRDLAVKDHQSAIEYLSKACEMLSTIHGEMGDELGDAYFTYGKALLGSYRDEAGVLGDKIEKEKEDGDDEDEDDNSDDGEEEEGDGTGDRVEEPAGADTPAGEAAPASNSATEEGGDDNGEAAETDANDLQLSWQFLELAKVIYARKADEDKEIGVKLSEVYLTLGENGLESESYSTALVDFETCLELQKKNLAHDDRRIAETLYQMGMAYGLMEKFEEAIFQLGESVTQLQKRMETLHLAKQAGKEHPDDKTYDSFYTLDEELAEISPTIKEIMDKITDMQDYQKHLKDEVRKRLIGDGFEAQPSSVGGPSSSSASTSAAATSLFIDVFGPANGAGLPATSTIKPTSNISHLVRKKRKTDEELEKEEKRAKTEEVSQ